MIADIFIQLGIILFMAFIIAAILRFFKQPFIISYILTGIILGPFVLNIIMPEDLKTFSEIGIAILLFMVGININPKIIKDVGKTALVTGIGQIIFTSLIGYLIAMLFGFSSTASLYIAVALTFSSTIIIMKLLSDKGDLDSLYGRISVGFLIVQDIVAILIMLFISSMSQSSGAGSAILMTLVKGVLMIGAVMMISHFLLPKFTNSIAKSQELLFMFSIAWCLSVATLFYYFGFSIEIGALLAGVSLSLSPYRYEINSKLKPLRDFFISLFFIYLGSQLILGDVSKYMFEIVIFSLFILVGNPLIVVILMGRLGYESKIGFLSGLTVAQISEFSLILVALGVKFNHLGSEILSLVTVIGLITIAGSTYFITYGDKIYPKVSGLLKMFEKKDIHKVKKVKDKNYDIILFGCHRLGYELLDNLQKKKNSCLAIDYDPELISKLEEKGMECMYGDADDSEFLDELPLEKAKLVISTIPDTDTNMLIIEKVKEVNKNAVIIAVSHQIADTMALYESGATYVIMPYFLGVHHTTSIITEYGTDLEKYLKEKINHLGYIQKMKSSGHDHPKRHGS